MRRLRRLKWVVLGLDALFLAAVEAYYYFVRGVPLADDLVDWLIGMAGAALLTEIAFRAVGKLQCRIRQEIAERQRAEEALREAHDELERRVQERTAELTKANEVLRAEIVERKRAEAALWESEERYRSLFDSVPVGLYRITPEGQIIAANPALVQESFDYHHVALFTVDRKRGEIVLRAVAGSYASRTPRDLRLDLTEGMVGWTATHGVTRLTNDVSTDLHYVRGSFDDAMTQAELCVPIKVGGETMGVLDVQSPQRDAFDESDVIAIETLADQVAVAIGNARLFEQVRASHERMRQLTQRIVSAQEEERRRLSRELHDEAGQALTALKISLELIQADLPVEDGSLRQRIGEALALTYATMERIRLLAQDLRPPALDTVGLNPTLEGFCQDFARRTQLSIDYVGSGLLVLPDTVNICLYRFLQEALTNVAKHTNANHVRVTLRYAGEMVTLSVEDDGQGFDKCAAMSVSSQNTGVGLLGMQERLDVLGGWLEIESQPGQGTRLVAHVPWQTDEQAALPPLRGELEGGRIE